MAINEGDILRQLEAQDIGKSADEVYKDFITELSDSIVDNFKAYTKSHTKGSGTLAQSFVAKPTRSGFEISADFYYEYINEGVSGVGGRNTTRPVVTNSPYKFKHLKVGRRMEKSIAQWTGKSLGMNYGVAVSIKKHGIKGKDITGNVITDELLAKISKDLTTITGLTVQATFRKHSE